MKKLQISELPDELQSAIEMVKNTAKKADSKYYQYNVCAMIIDELGNKFLGVNWEPANGDSTCGEVGAISNYVLSDKHKIKYVLTYGYPKNTKAREEVFCTPCGRCRQRLLDYVDKATVCYGVNETVSQVEEYTFEELLPHSFSSANLNE